MNYQIKFHLVLTVIILTAGIANGQVVADIAPSTWTVSSHTDETNNQTYNQASVVELTANMFAWGPDSSQMMEFTIDSASGNWDKSSNTGDIHLVISAAEGGNGKVAIEGTGGDIVIILDLSFTNGSGKIKLNISGVNYH